MKNLTIYGLFVANRIYSGSGRSSYRNKRVIGTRVRRTTAELERRSSREGMEQNRSALYPTTNGRHPFLERVLLQVMPRNIIVISLENFKTERKFRVISKRVNV